MSGYGSLLQWSSHQQRNCSLENTTFTNNELELCPVRYEYDWNEIKIHFLHVEVANGLRSCCTDVLKLEIYCIFLNEVVGLDLYCMFPSLKDTQYSNIILSSTVCGLVPLDLL